MFLIVNKAGCVTSKGLMLLIVNKAGCVTSKGIDASYSKYSLVLLTTKGTKAWFDIHTSHYWLRYKLFPSLTRQELFA